MLEESASSADSVKVVQLISVLFDGLKDGSLSERCLIYHVRVFCDLGSIVVDAYAHNFLFILEHADLGRGSARVDYKNFHFWILLSVSDLANLCRFDPFYECMPTCSCGCCIYVSQAP